MKIAEQLRNLAQTVRKTAEELDGLRLQKNAQVLVAARGLSVLRQLLSGKAVR
jgi:hypothetical protein